MDCADVSLYTTITDSYNVSAEFRNICLWGIVTFAMSIAGSLALTTKTTEKCAGLLSCVGCCGGLAWFISANIFVFRE